MGNMGSRVSRMFRNFNLENRAHREIGKAKPLPAPRHPTSKSNPEPREQDPAIDDSIHKRNDSLVTLLKSVYVDSRDTPAQPVKTLRQAKEERRPAKCSLPNDSYGMVELDDIPKGKLSIVEALNALNWHKRSPQTWTPEKIAEEFSLSVDDTKALVKFYIPFEVKIIPPKTESVKQIKAS